MKYNPDLVKWWIMTNGVKTTPEKLIGLARKVRHSDYALWISLISLGMILLAGAIIIADILTGFNVLSRSLPRFTTSVATACLLIIVWISWGVFLSKRKMHPFDLRCVEKLNADLRCLANSLGRDALKPSLSQSSPILMAKTSPAKEWREERIRRLRSDHPVEVAFESLRFAATSVLAHWAMYNMLACMSPDPEVEHSGHDLVTTNQIDGMFLAFATFGLISHSLTREEAPEAFGETWLPEPELA